MVSKNVDIDRTPPQPDIWRLVSYSIHSLLSRASQGRRPKQTLCTLIISVTTYKSSGIRTTIFHQTLVWCCCHISRKLKMFLTKDPPPATHMCSTHIHCVKENKHCFCFLRITTVPRYHFNKRCCQDPHRWGGAVEHSHSWHDTVQNVHRQSDYCISCEKCAIVICSAPGNFEGWFCMKNSHKVAICHLSSM